MTNRELLAVALVNPAESEAVPWIPFARNVSQPLRRVEPCASRVPVRRHLHPVQRND
jgi:hypothetical protein